MGKKSGPDTPAAPDYEGLARQQADINQQNLLSQTYANRPNQVTPWGSMTWTPGKVRDPVTGEQMTSWTQEQSLPGWQENLLRRQKQMAGGRSNLAEKIRRKSLGKSMYRLPDYSQFREVGDTESIPGLRERAEDAVYGRMTSRLDPRFEEGEESLMARLRNQGLRPGDEAYDREVANFERGRTDAYQAAMMDAVGAGRAEAGQLFGQGQQRQAQNAMLRQQEIAEALRARQQPLVDIEMLLGGQGVQRPSMPGFQGTGMAQTPNLLGAAGQGYQGDVAAYNAAQANRQSGMSGLFGLASAALPLIPGF